MYSVRCVKLVGLPRKPGNMQVNCPRDSQLMDNMKRAKREVQKKIQALRARRDRM